MFDLVGYRYYSRIENAVKPLHWHVWRKTLLQVVSYHVGPMICNKNLGVDRFGCEAKIVLTVYENFFFYFKVVKDGRKEYLEK